jgi:hypothetical protein
METGIQIYLPDDIILGYIDCLPQQRLLDRINGITASYLPSEKEFLVINKNGIAGGHTASGELIYIKKANILFISAVNGSGHIPAASKLPGNVYPFVRKFQVRVECHIPDYILTGNIYCGKNMDMQNLVRKDMGFFPVTGVHIRCLGGNTSLAADFVAVNKDRLLYMRYANGTFINSMPSCLQTPV